MTKPAITPMNTDDPPPVDTLAAIITALAANTVPAAVLARLQALEPSLTTPADRARLGLTRGIATNRLGLPGEALGVLHEARHLFASIPDAGGEAETWRAVAQVQAWRGDGREAALALVHALALAHDRPETFAPALLDAGRLNLEIGRMAEARALLEQGLAVGGATLSPVERQRAQIVVAQTFIATDDPTAALRTLASISLDGATARVHHLVAIETARAVLRAGDAGRAEALLAQAETPAEKSFEQIERDEVAAELARHKGDGARALALLRGVVARYADDDLAGREVDARLAQAAILVDLARYDDANRTLFAALHRAKARGLTGHADRVREALALRGETGLAWSPGAPPTVPAEDDQSRFVHRRPLGEGGFGTVSRAYDLESGTEVALKRLRLAGIYDSAVREAQLAAARNEVAAAARLRHPGIGQIFGLLLEPDGDALVVREFVEGPVLRDLMSTRLASHDAFGLLARLAHALAAVHAAGIVHRDLKPENIVLRGGTSPVIIDFGASAVGTDQGRGYTTAYAAPEQIAGRRSGPSADLFALGIIAFELLTGTRPERPPAAFRAVFARRHAVRRMRDTLAASAISQPAAAIIMTLLRANPRARPRSATDAALVFQDAAV